MSVPRFEYRARCASAFTASWSLGVLAYVLAPSVEVQLLSWGLDLRWPVVWPLAAFVGSLGALLAWVLHPARYRRWESLPLPPPGVGDSPRPPTSHAGEVDSAGAARGRDLGPLP